jgi:hypothetical protein
VPKDTHAAKERLDWQLRQYQTLCLYVIVYFMLSLAHAKRTFYGATLWRLYAYESNP